MFQIWWLIRGMEVIKKILLTISKNTPARQKKNTGTWGVNIIIVLYKQIDVPTSHRYSSSNNVH